jgi:endonuclease YncB( thermonuclease family)
VVFPALVPVGATPPAATGSYDFGLQQVTDGWSRAFRFEGSRFVRYAAYKEAEDNARTEPAGVWASCGGDFHAPL